MRGRALAAIALTIGSALGACKRAPEHAVPDAAGSAAPWAALEQTRRPPPPQIPLYCRAIQVDGEIRRLEGDMLDQNVLVTALDAGDALASRGNVDSDRPGDAAAAGAHNVRTTLRGGDSLAPHETYDLAEGARFVVKDPRTSRETTFAGPGHVRACIWDHEESWMTNGHFESSIGAGEAPGAEEWVVTPHAVVRYTAAQLRIDATDTGTVLAVGAGTAFVWAADDARSRAVPNGDGGADAGRDDDSDRPWRRVSAAAWKIDVPGGLDGRPVVEACLRHAQEANRLARLLLSHDDASAGEAAARIAEQVRERRMARAACALATVRIAAAPSPDRADHLDAVRRANVLWESVPLAAK
jgi:hypothetical protein